MAPELGAESATTVGNGHHDHSARVPHARLVPQADGPAIVLAIGTANPPDIIEQSTYHERLFAMCGISDNETLKAKFKRMDMRGISGNETLKAKFKRIANNKIEKRHTCITEEVIKEHPELASYTEENSLTTRVNMANKVVPKIAIEAVHAAVKEWGRPLSDITHMVFATTAVTSIPGVDLEIARTLGLKPNVQRICMYQTGCWGGGATLRIAKNLAESQKGARVLIVSAETNTIMNFRKPIEDTLYKVDGFQAHVAFGDGAAALIIGSDALPSERPIFEICWSTQVSPPDTWAAMHGNLSEHGLLQYLGKDYVPTLITKYLPEIAAEGRALVGNPEPRDMFWIVHPGAWKILEVVAEAMGLDNDHLQPSWNTLRDYGNMSSPTCLFVLNEMRNLSKRTGASTTGRGNEWGMLLGFGPGFNMEVSLLRSFPQ